MHTFRNASSNDVEPMVPGPDGPRLESNSHDNGNPVGSLIRERARSRSTLGSQLSSALQPVDKEWFQGVDSFSNPCASSDIHTAQSVIYLQTSAMREQFDALTREMTRNDEDRFEKLEERVAHLEEAECRRNRLNVSGSDVHVQVRVEPSSHEEPLPREGELYEKIAELQGQMGMLRHMLSKYVTVHHFQSRLATLSKTLEHHIDALQMEVSADLKLTADDLALVAEVGGGGLSTSELNTKYRRTPDDRPAHEKKKLSADMLDSFVSICSSYQVRGNVWDATLFLGTDIPMGRQGTVLMVTSVFLNIAVQLFICYFVVELAFDQSSDLEDGLIENIKLWKLQTTQDISDRICRHDFTLTTDYRQAATHDLYDTYLRSNSWMLCLGMLVVWTLTVQRELNMVLLFTKAVWNIPVESKTTIEVHSRKVLLITVGHTKRLATVGIAVIQIGICCSLLLAGVAWLSATETQEELLLNSVALAYIMEVDELLYSIMVPRKVRAIIEQMAPLTCEVQGAKSHRLQNSVARWLRPIVCIFLVVTVYFGWIDPRLQMMADVLSTVCS